MPEIAERLTTEERQRYDRTRFGYKGALGDLTKTVDIVWPDYTEEYEVKGHRLIYKKISEITQEAVRIAEIYQRSLDEFIGNPQYEWHHDPQQIIARVQAGDWNFYGIYCEDKLIGVVSAFINRAQRSWQWVWGGVDPEERGKGVWSNLGVYLDHTIARSGAQVGLLFCVTTHILSQRTVEAGGFRPIGCFIGGEFLGGSDGRYYRQNVIYYGKLYGEGNTFTQSFDAMQLTPMAQKIVNVVKHLWNT